VTESRGESHDTPARQRPTARAARLGHPAVFMSVIWLVYAGLFAIGPLEFLRQPGATTWSLVAGGVGLFVAAALLADRHTRAEGRRLEPSLALVERMILVTAVAGLVGIGLIAVDKLFLSGLDYSKGLAHVRFQRVEEIEAGIDVPRSPLLYLGTATFSFSYVAALLYVLRGEGVRFGVAALAEISIVSPVAYALVYGGRNPIMLFFVLLVGGMLARGAGGRRLLPPMRGLWIKLALGLVLFAGYVNYTWKDRRQMWRYDEYATFLRVVGDRWQARPKPWLDETMASGILAPATVMDAMSLGLYVTHSVTTLDKIVRRRHELDRFWGNYQCGVFAPLVRRLPGGAALLERLFVQLRVTGTYGWFPTAWGALLVDFGPGGAELAVLAWGLAAGWAYARVRQGADLRAELMLSFVLATIAFSPITAPFGMANSALVFISLLIASASPGALSFLQARWRAGRAGAAEGTH
jgi:hypothetical protein